MFINIYVEIINIEGSRQSRNLWTYIFHYWAGWAMVNVPSSRDDLCRSPVHPLYSQWYWNMVVLTSILIYNPPKQKIKIITWCFLNFLHHKQFFKWNLQRISLLLSKNFTTDHRKPTRAASMVQPGRVILQPKCVHCKMNADSKIPQEKLTRLPGVFFSLEFLLRGT